MPRDVDILIRDLDFYGRDSRYRDLLIYQNKYLEYIHELPMPLYIEKDEEDGYYEVKVENLNRLDSIAQQVYNNPRLWWVIAKANSIIDPFTIPVGTVLVIPSITKLYGAGGVLV